MTWAGSLRRYGAAELPFGDAVLRLSTLQDTRGVLRLAGRDVHKFLQGLITNDVQHLEYKEGASLYAALLTPKGRIAHDVVVYRDSGLPGKDAVLMDSDRRTLTQLMTLIKTYRLRSEVDVDDVSATHRVCCLYGDPTLSDARRLDPRLSSLGYRFVSPLASIPLASLTDATVYKEWRLLHGVAEDRAEIPPEALPLEYNLDGLNGVSFVKGCYVGQELTARTRFQGVIRKRIFPATLSRPSQHAVAGSGVLSNGKRVGELRSVVREHVLAFLRLQSALEAVQRVEGGGLVLEGDASVAVMPKIPTWWPSSWSGN